MRLTRFRGVDGTIFVIPNGDIRLVGNLRAGWARAIVDLTLPGASAADLERVRSVIGEAAHEVAHEPEFAGHAPSRRRWSGCSRADADDDHHAGDAADRARPSATPLTRALREATTRGAGVVAAALAGRAPSTPRRRHADAALSGRRSADVRRVGRLRRLPHGLDRRVLPGPQLSCAAAWCTSMPSPSTVVAPAAAASASHGVGRGA